MHLRPSHFISNRYMLFYGKSVASCHHFMLQIFRELFVTPIISSHEYDNCCELMCSQISSFSLKWIKKITIIIGYNCYCSSSEGKLFERYKLNFGTIRGKYWSWCVIFFMSSVQLCISSYLQLLYLQFCTIMHFFIFRCFIDSNQTFHQNAIQFSRLAKTFVEMKLNRKAKIIPFNMLSRVSNGDPF